MTRLYLTNMYVENTSPGYASRIWALVKSYALSLPDRWRAGLTRIITRFRTNHRGFWQTYRLWIIFFVLALVWDALGTAYFMLTHGTDYEIHPFIRYVSEICGPVAGPFIGALGKITAGLVVVIYCRYLAKLIFLVTGLVALFAGFYNLLAYQLYISKFLYWLPW